MINISMKELVATGYFGPVRLCMSRAQVESLLGHPDDWGGRSLEYSKATILKYGDVELHFDPIQYHLVLIHMDDFDVPSGRRLINLDAWIIRQSLKVSEAEEYLSRSGIDYEVMQAEYEDDATLILAGVGVKLLFMGEEGCLRAVSYSIPPAI